MRWVVGACLLSVAIALAGCLPPQQSGGTGGTGVRAGAVGPVHVKAAVLDQPPGFYQGSASAFVGTAGIATIEMLVNSGLTVADNRDALIPRLAEAVPTVENGLWVLTPDGRATTTWTIRPGVSWHDGAAFSADDVLFSLRVRMDPELDFPAAVAYTYIEDIQAPDPRTVRISWKQPYINADSFLSLGLFPRHLLERAYQESKPTMRSLSFWTTDFVGTGPFKLKEWMAGSHVVVTANEAYVLGKPRIDEMDIKFFGDTNVLFANLLGGGAEVAFGKAITTEQGLVARKDWTEGRVEIAAAAAIRMRPQFLYPDPPIMLQRPFRRALYHATDRQTLVDALMGGLSFAADDYIISPNDPPYFDPAKARIVRYPHDPRRALELVQGLGYSRSPDGLLRDANGQGISIGIRTNTVDLNQKITLSVADQWKQVGIEGSPEYYTLAQGGDLEWRGKFPGVELLRSGFTPEGFHCRQQKTPANNWRGGNSGYCNPAFDGLVERYETTVPLAQRMTIFGDIVQHMSEQVVVIPILWDVEPIMIGNRLQGIQATRGNHAWNAHEWTVTG